jgi:hypothetical protein
MHRIDKEINNDTLVVCKCLVPYLDRDMQRNMAILIKAFELLYTIKLFSSDEFIKSISVERKNGWHTHLLHDVKKNIDPNRAYLIDMVLKFTEFQKIMTTKQALNVNDKLPHQSAPDVSLPPTLARDKNEESPSDIMSEFSSVLEPNQLQLLKMLSTFLNAN